MGASEMTSLPRSSWLGFARQAGTQAQTIRAAAHRTEIRDRTPNLDPLRKTRPPCGVRAQTITARRPLVIALSLTVGRVYTGLGRLERRCPVADANRRVGQQTL